MLHTYPTLCHFLRKNVSILIMGAKFEIILDFPPDLDNFCHSSVLHPALYILYRRIFWAKCIILPPDLDICLQSINIPPDLYLFRQMHYFPPRRIFLCKCIFLPPTPISFACYRFFLPPDAYFGKMY